MIIKKEQNKKVYEMLLSRMLPVLLFLLWYIWTAVLYPNTFLPSPMDVIYSAISMIKNGQLEEYTFITLKRALIGFLTGGGLGFLSGLLNGIFHLTDISLNYTIQKLSNIPVMAYMVPVVILFGLGENVKITLLAFAVFFPVYINIYKGIKSADKDLIEMGKAYGLSDFALFKEIVFPHAFFYLFIGIRRALNSMWMLLITIELISPDNGIGYMIMSAARFNQMDQLVLSVILLALLSKVSDAAARAFERRTLRWNRLF